MTAILINCVGVACSFPVVFSWAPAINHDSDITIIAQL